MMTNYEVREALRQLPSTAKAVTLVEYDHGGVCIYALNTNDPVSMVKWFHSFLNSFLNKPDFEPLRPLRPLSPNPKKKRSLLVISVDVARFGDEDSFIHTCFGGVFKSRRFRGLDTVQLVAKIRETIGEYSSWDSLSLFVDGTGVGGGVVDQLRSLGYSVEEVNPHKSGRNVTQRKFSGLYNSNGLFDYALERQRDLENEWS